MAVESLKNNNANVVQEMIAKAQNKPNMQQNQQMQQVQQEQQQQNQQPQDRVTLNSRQNTQGTNSPNNPALSVPGESQRPRGANSMDNTNNNNLVAQLISEAANRTTNTQQANNAYNPNKPTQTQNQINYTV